MFLWLFLLQFFLWVSYWSCPQMITDIIRGEWKIKMCDSTSKIPVLACMQKSTFYYVLKCMYRYTLHSTFLRTILFKNRPSDESTLSITCHSIPLTNCIEPIPNVIKKRPKHLKICCALSRNLSELSHLIKEYIEPLILT